MSVSPTVQDERVLTSPALSCEGILTFALYVFVGVFYGANISQAAYSYGTQQVEVGKKDSSSFTTDLRVHHH
jgi:hypothetical protein